MIKAAVKVSTIITALAGHETTGLRNHQVVEATGLTPAVVFQYLNTMKQEGFVEEVPGHQKHWRLGPAMIQIAQAHQRHIALVEQRLNEVKQRYSRDSWHTPKSSS